MTASTDGPLRQLRKALAAQVAGRPAPTAPATPPAVSTDATPPGTAQRTEGQRRPASAVTDGELSEKLATLPVLLRSFVALDAGQRAAATSPESATLVRAPVGSGKTTVLAHRVLWLRHALGVPLGQIAALTFTQAAAQELVGRVEAMVSDPGPDDGFGWFGTFHGVARATLARVGAGATGFGLCTESDGQALLAQVAADLRMGKRQLAAAWDDLALLRRGATTGWPADRLQRTTELLLGYRAALGRENLVDFDGLLESCAAWAAGASEAELPRWLVIDELQDCNELELRCLLAMRRPGTGLFAVGDPDQAIYGWRGGRGDVFEHLAASWPAAVVALGHNYRSTPEIGRAAAAAIGGSARAPVLHVRGAGQAIAVRRHVHAQMEGLYLSDRLRDLHARGAAWSSIAVLARTRDQLGTLQALVGDAGVPCAVRHRVEIWPDRPAALWLLQLLGASDGVGQQGALALRAVLAARPFAVGALSTWPVAALKKAAVANPNAPASALCASVTCDRRLCEWLTHLAELDSAAADHAADAAIRVSAHLDLAAHLHPSHRDHPRYCRQATDALHQVAQLRAAIRSSWATAARLTLADQPAPDDRHTATDGVAFHTFHSAKGLEFNHVFVSGCNQGVVPLAKAFADRAQWAEERRLLYVAMTRARDTLELSWHAQPAVRGGLGMPSEWLLALPADASCWVDELAAAATAAPPEPETVAQTAVAAVTAHALAWPPGAAVRHAKYGTGVVVHCDEAQVHVAFGKLGEKSFSLLLCPLERA